MRLQSIILIIQATDWYVVRHAPRQGTAVVTGQANNTHKNNRRERKHNFSSWPLFSYMCENMLPYRSTRSRDKETMHVCNARRRRC